MSVKNDSLVKDANGISIQVGSGFLTTDGINASPFTLAAGVNAIAIPQECCEIAIYPVTSDLKVSEDSTMTHYDLVLKGSKEPYPCARMSTIYIQGSAADVVYYRFHYV